MQPVRIGVLALQGSFREHMALLRRIPGVEPVEVRTKEELDSVAGLIIPGARLDWLSLEDVGGGGMRRLLLPLPRAAASCLCLQPRLRLYITAAIKSPQSSHPPLLARIFACPACRGREHHHGACG